MRRPSAEATVHTCAKCEVPIAEQEGAIVSASDGRAWLVCVVCVRGGDVRIGDVEHREPVFAP
jgi:hypothetical protein